MVKIDLIGVPYTSMAAPGGIANAIAALRAAGLAAALGARADVRDAGDLELPEPTGARGASGLLNEAALGRLVEGTREAVRSSLDSERRPLLVGGDCPVLLGALAAGRDRHGAAGLLLVDGHEDGWPPLLSNTGEASDSEVAVALGLVADLPEPLDRLTPLLRPGDLAMLGPRDSEELNQAGVDSLETSVAVFRDDGAVRARAPAASAREAIGALETGSVRFWLHVDLDVLRTEDFAAADYLQPGGLSWQELSEIAGQAWANPRCLGCSVVIYNPDLDPERTAAARVVRFLADLVDT